METKNIVLIVVFIFGLVYLQYIHSQIQTVDEIINRYAEARGGKERLNAISSLYMKGLRQMMGNYIPVNVTMVNGKLYRNDFEIGGKKGYTIVTPEQGWSFIPMSSQHVQAISENNLKVMQTEMDIAGPLIDYVSKGNKPELEGKEIINGKEAFKIKLTSAEGKEVIYFIDTKDYLLIQTKKMRGGMGRDIIEMEVVTNYDDYKPVEGILFPHEISNPGAGPGAGSTVFDSIELNSSIHESWYRPPGV